MLGLKRREHGLSRCTATAQERFKEAVADYSVSNAGCRTQIFELFASADDPLGLRTEAARSLRNPPHQN